MAEILKKNWKRFLLFLILGLTFIVVFLFFKNFPIKAQEEIKIFSTFYSGDPSDPLGTSWQNPEAVFSQDLGENATFEEFSGENSASPAFIEELLLENTTSTPIMEISEKILELSNFSISEQEKQIQNVQLRMSLAAKGQVGDKLTIDYYFKNTWQNLAKFDLENEISNSLNDGYFLYGLPIFESWQDLGNLKIKFTYRGSQNSKVFLDSLWLEVEYEELKKEPPKIIETELQSIGGGRKNFRSDEEPKFNLEGTSSFYEKKTVEAILINPGGEEVQEGITIQGNKIKISQLDKRSFRPGLYKLKIIIREGNEEFIQWENGVKSIFLGIFMLK